MTQTDIRSILMRDLLSEFSIFGRIEPLQLRVQSINAKKTEEQILLGEDLTMEDLTQQSLLMTTGPFSNPYLSLEP